MNKLKMVFWFCFLYGLLQHCDIVATYNIPACHKGIMSLFNWCEQSDCKNNCTCLSANHVCKQICGEKECGLLFCSSPKTCYQSVLVNRRAKVPKVTKLISHSPIAQQDCSQGKCILMKALRYDNKFTRTFQSCSEGTCGHIYSTGDHVKQFCGNCKKMICTGSHSQNCTQLCVLGACKEMTCNAKYCKQLCSHQSTCNITCGKNAEVCEQICSHGSKCTMNCYGKDCKQSCTEGSNCDKNIYNNKTLTTAVPTTKLDTTSVIPTTTDKTSTSTTVVTASLHTSTDISNEVELLIVKKSDINDVEATKYKSSDYRLNSVLSLTLYLSVSLLFRVLLL